MKKRFICTTSAHFIVVIYWLQQRRWTNANSYSTRSENSIVCRWDNSHNKGCCKALSFYAWEYQLFQCADSWDCLPRFEPTSQLFPIYRNIEVHSYGKVLLHITTFVSSLNSQIFTDLSLVSESGKFYLSDCYPRNIENDSHYAKDNKVIAESREKRATEWGEFLSILRKHGKLIK